MIKKRSMDELNRMTPSEFKRSEKIPVVIVLDDVRSAYNVGSVFRTADAFRVSGIYLCGISARPPHKDIAKTALGATESVDWKYYSDIGEAIRELKAMNYQIYAVEQVRGSIDLALFIPGPGAGIALVFGHEVFGVKEEVIQISDGCLEIPQFGTKHSFNVAVSAGIVLWDITCKIK